RRVNGAGLDRRLGPADVAAQIVVGGAGLRQRDGEGLVLLRRHGWHLPDGDVGLRLLVHLHALIAGPGRLDNLGLLRDDQPPGRVFHGQTLARQPAVFDHQLVGHTIGDRLPFAEPRDEAGADTDLARPVIDLPQLGFPYAVRVEIAHANTQREVL